MKNIILEEEENASKITETLKKQIKEIGEQAEGLGKEVDILDDIIDKAIEEKKLAEAKEILRKAEEAKELLKKAAEAKEIAKKVAEAKLIAKKIAEEEAIAKKKAEAAEIIKTAADVTAKSIKDSLTKNKTEDISEEIKPVPKISPKTQEKETISPSEASKTSVNEAIPPTEEPATPLAPAKTEPATPLAPTKTEPAASLSPAKTEPEVKHTPEETQAKPTEIEHDKVLTPLAPSKLPCNLTCFRDCLDLKKFVPYTVIQQCIDIKCHCKVKAITNDFENLISINSADAIVNQMKAYIEKDQGFSTVGFLFLALLLVIIMGGASYFYYKISLKGRKRKEYNDYGASESQVYERLA